MPGRKSKYFNECIESNFIGADYSFDIDLTNQLVDNWKDFNKKFIPYFLDKHPNKTKIAAGLACGTVWTVSKGIKIGDIIICPDGNGLYKVGEIESDYLYNKEGILPHRRKVNWFYEFENSQISEALKTSLYARGTLIEISKHAEQIETLIQGLKKPKIVSTDETIEDPTVFALEKHLEDFLVKNWNSTVLGKEYSIFEEDGEIAGQQYLSDTGPIDILAVSKDNKTLLVIELKKGRATDVVVGQIQRYMGYVKDELAEPGQNVKGIIIALEEDIKIKRALSVVNNIDFYRYEINFSLIKVI